MTDRLAELGALLYAAENSSVAATNKDYKAGAGQILAAYNEYLTWKAANPNTTPSRLTARGRLYGYFDSYFTPLNLFSSGEVGAWYDPSDLTSMYQDSAGTTAAALEQPVGLILDKSKGLVLGSEKIINGTFSSGTNWTTNTGVAIANSRMEFSAAAAGFLFFQDGGGQYYGSGRYYQIEFDYSTNQTLAVLISGTTISTVFAGSGHCKCYGFAANDTLGRFQLNANGSNATGWIDNISVRELPGNHATQSVSTSRPTLSARVNLLVDTENFANATNWTLDNSGATNPVVTANAGTAPNGTLTADRVVLNKTGGVFSRIQSSASATIGVTYKFGVYLKSYSGTTYNVGLRLDTIGINVVVTNEWQFFTISAAAAASSIAGQIILYDAIAGNDETADILAWGADLRVANDGVGLPAYQRVDTASSYDTSGFPYYLRFDGIDDSLATGSIDFTATDKMSVFAGVRKLSDAAIGMVYETSVNAGTTAGAIQLYTATDKTFTARARGSLDVVVQTAAQVVAPASFVTTLTGDIPGNSTIFRVNGTQAASSVASQGTGKYGNYPLYIGQRSGSSLPYIGRIYSLIVRGAQSTAAQITATETWCNQKTKAY